MGTTISQTLEKANNSGVGKINFDSFWDLDDDAQIQLFESSVLPLLNSICGKNTVILGKSFNRHHFGKGFLLEEIYDLEDKQRCIKHFIAQNFIVNYVLVEPSESSWQIKIVGREYCKKYQIPKQSAA